MARRTDYTKESLRLHKRHKGKIEIKSKVSLGSKKELSLSYSPGVAAPCLEISRDRSKAYDYTSKGNMVAVVSDGSAVLGLGKIGPQAALPVMEGKAILFKEFGGVDAFPILVDSYDTEEIISTVVRIAPGFGGINLEDISSPRCFEIEERLDDLLDIPVFHDDQHGTAAVVLAGLINSAKVVGKELKEFKVTINGAGAAGIAIARILIECGIKDIIVLDSKGALYYCREDIQMNRVKKEIARLTNASCRLKKGQAKDPEECARCNKGGLADSVLGRDVFIGVSVGKLLTQEMVRSMAKDPIIFALANPEPEIMPDLAIAAGAAVAASGRSDYPNQINNVLCFPHIFRGALDAAATRINKQMVIAAAYALAESVKSPRADKIIPDVFEKQYRVRVAKAVYDAAV
ncbi:NADP-dependent malic enzyme [Candidatus Woesearchaeota archaeon]|nr:NADP-dependent malic enzyme [Candidatus Woesearchaeota archaeon]